MSRRYLPQFDTVQWILKITKSPRGVSLEEASSECVQLNARLDAVRDDPRAMELELLGIALDRILSFPGRTERVAALRILVRGTSGELPLLEDLNILLAAEGEDLKGE